MSLWVWGVWLFGLSWPISGDISLWVFVNQWWCDEEYERERKSLSCKKTFITKLNFKIILLIIIIK